jgi:hypothetical protein
MDLSSKKKKNDFPFYNYEKLGSNLFQKIKNKKINIDPILVCENFFSVIKYIEIFFFFKKKKMNTVIYLISVYVFLFLITNGHYLEAKFFVYRCCANLFCNSKISSSLKITIQNLNTFDSKEILKYLKKKIIFDLKIPKLLKKIIFFIEKKDLSFFYKNLQLVIFLNKKFLYKNFKKINFREKIVPNKKIRQYDLREEKNKKREIKAHNLAQNYENKTIGVDFLKIVRIRSRYPSLINSIDLSFDNKTVVIGYQNALIHVYNLINGNNRKKVLTLKGHEYSVFCAKKFKFGEYILSASCRGELYLWGLKQKGLVFNYQAPTHSIWDLVLSRDEKNFLTGGSDGLSFLWQIDRLFPVRFFNGHKSDVNTIKWHSDVNFIVTGSDDKTVRLWDIRVKKSIGKIFFGASVKSLDFSYNGDNLTIGGQSKFITTLNMRTLKSRFIIKEDFLKNKIDKILYLNKEDFAYVKDGNIIKIWKSSTSKLESNPTYGNFEKFSLIKTFPHLDRIFQLKTQSCNKMTIVGLSL